MAAQTFDSIRWESGNGIVTVALDRPRQRNAMSAHLVSELIEAIARFDLDDDLRVLVLTGAGTGFCADSDLGGLAGMTNDERHAFEAASGRVARMMGESAKTVIAAVHGFAVGGGLTLAAQPRIA